MKTWEPTTVKTRIAAATLSLAIATLLPGVVAGGFIDPDPDTVAARQQAFASQAEQAARIRAFLGGELRCVDAGPPPQS